MRRSCVPDNFDAARPRLAARFPEASRRRSARLFAQIARRVIAARRPTRRCRFRTSSTRCSATRTTSNARSRRTSLITMTIRRRWRGRISRAAQGRYLPSGARYVQGGSQRLSSALARAIRAAGGEVAGAPRRHRIASMPRREAPSRTPPRTAAIRRPIDAARVISNAAPETLAELLPARRRRDADARIMPAIAPSISLFALTLGIIEAAARVRLHRLFDATVAAVAEAACRFRARHAR